MSQAQALMVARFHGPVQNATLGSPCSTTRSSTSFAPIGARISCEVPRDLSVIVPLPHLCGEDPEEEAG
jgi:hypothetical protein